MGSKEKSGIGTETSRANLEKIAEAKTGPEATKHILWSGWIEVGEGQKLYAIEWGTRGTNPCAFFHGGPGQSFQASHFAPFDPETDHVIFFDQPGCGESTPSAGVQSREEIQESNTPAHIIRYTGKLLEHFGLEKVHLVGGSWGSTIALLYAIKHPEKVASLQLWSLYLATREQTLSIYEDKTVEPGFPDMCKVTWQEFIELVPENLRTNEDGRISPQAIMEYYASKEGVNHMDPAVALKFAEAYLIYEYALCQPDGSETDPEGTLKGIRDYIVNDPNTLAAARIELTYNVNGTFLEDDYILNNIDLLKGIPAKIVQGKRDWCTPTKFARKFERALGEPCVEEVDSGHLRSDPEMLAALRRNIHNVPPITSEAD